MANFDEIKKVAVETAEVIADKSLVFAKKASEKAKVVAKIAKLSTEVAAERENIRKKYVEIGKKYYELHKGDAEEAVAQEVADISISLAVIESKKGEIDNLKNEAPGCAEDAECDCGCSEEPSEEEKAESDDSNEE